MPNQFLLRITLLFFLGYIAQDVCAQVNLGPYFSNAQIDSIRTSNLSQEGDLYLDTSSNNYYVGIENGDLIQINTDSGIVRGMIRSELLDEDNMISNSDSNAASQQSVKAYIDSILNAGGEYSIFPIVAEENAALANNGFEWAFGNGGSTNADNGIVAPAKCYLFAVGLSTSLGSGAEVQVLINGASSGLTSGVIGGSDFSSFRDSLPGIEVNPGDIINFQTVTGGTATKGIAVAWFRLNSFSGRLQGIGVPSVSLGDEGDVYIDTNSGNQYVKSTGEWIFELNLKGPSGPSGGPLIAGGGVGQVLIKQSATDFDVAWASTPAVQIMRMNLTNQANLNANTTGTLVELGGLTLNTISGASLSGDTVVLPAGTYEFSLITSVSSTAQRPNLGWRSMINEVMYSRSNTEGNYIRIY